MSLFGVICSLSMISISSRKQGLNISVVPFIGQNRLLGAFTCHIHLLGTSHLPIS
jgi:hypothetical protein